MPIKIEAIVKMKPLQFGWRRAFYILRYHKSKKYFDLHTDRRESQVFN